MVAERPLPHRRFYHRGRDFSLSCTRLRPTAREKHSDPWVKIALLFEPASGIYTRWDRSGETREARLAGRQVYCIGADVLHAVHWETEAPLIEILLEPSFVNAVPANHLAAALARELLDGAAHDPVLWLLASTIRRLCSQREQPKMPSVNAVVGSLVHRLFSSHHECYAPKPGPRLSEERTQLVLDYIDEHLGQILRVGKLAGLVALSEPHFTELFRNRTGKAPMEYIREHRRIRAHEMVLDGEMRMGEIADATGFADQSHLTREFKRFFGYPAKLFRG